MDLIEVGGSGGVFQHSLAVGLALQGQGFHVSLHTASDPEMRDPSLEMRTCFDWCRSFKWLRKVRIVLVFLFRTIPHVLGCEGRVWVQGSFKPFFTFLMLVCLRVRGRPFIFSPHTLFARDGGAFNQAFLNLCIATATELVVYNTEDLEQLRDRGKNAHLAPLIMYTPLISKPVAEYWKAQVKLIGAQVCSVGQIRADKNLPMLVEASAAASAPLLIIGADAGAYSDLKRSVAAGPDGACAVYEGYYPLEALAAVIAIIGTVALPYSVASTSAVAVLAKAYGANVLAYAVGGLIEQADILIDSLQPDAWAAAIRSSRADNWDNPIPAPIGPTNGQIDQLVTIIQGAAA